MKSISIFAKKGIGQALQRMIVFFIVIVIARPPELGSVLSSSLGVNEVGLNSVQNRIQLP